MTGLPERDELRRLAEPTMPVTGPSAPRTATNPVAPVSEVGPTGKGGNARVLSGESTILIFDVIGTPAPQGSKRHVGNGVMIESSKAVGPWRDSVAYAARDAMRAKRCPRFEGPVELSIEFRLVRPKSAPKRRRYPDGRPDLSKLVRATEDAITTAGVWRDDSQVVKFADIGKVYAQPDDTTGASITIRSLA